MHLAMPWFWRTVLQLCASALSRLDVGCLPTRVRSTLEHWHVGNLACKRGPSCSPKVKWWRVSHSISAWLHCSIFGLTVWDPAWWGTLWYSHGARAAVWMSMYMQIYDYCHRVDGLPARTVCFVGREGEQYGLSRPSVCDRTASILLKGLFKCASCSVSRTAWLDAPLTHEVFLDGDCDAAVRRERGRPFSR